MKKKLLIGFIFILLPFIINAQNKYSRVQITVNQSEYQLLGSTGIALDDAFFSKEFVIAELSETDILKLKNYGFQVDILIDDISDFYVNRNKNSNQITRYDKTPNNFNLGSMGGNLTNDEFIAELDEMYTLYPNLITQKQNIGGIQTTTDGNEIYVVKISDNPEVDEDEPEVLYTGMHHAREPVSMMHLIYYMWYLLENYETNPEIQYLVDNFEQYFIPVVNPDGYIYNEQTDPNGGGMFRKNRRNNGDGSYGVDLNRNYPYQWAFDDNGSSPNTDDDTYRGPSAGSEPETQIMMNYVSSRNFLIANNHHTYSNLMLYPYGYSEDAVNEEVELFEEYAAIMTRVNHFACGRAWELLYTVNGEANDWMYNQNGVYAFTAETGTYSDGFWPAQDRIIPLCDENLYMNQMMVTLAGSYAEARDLSSSFGTRCGSFEFDMTFLGLDTTAEFRVYLTGDNIGYSDTAYFSEYNFLQVIHDSVNYFLNDNVNYGDEYSIDIVVDNGLTTFKTTVNKLLQKNEIIFEDLCNDLSNWSSSSWNTTSDDFHSPNFSITDSPYGNYNDNSTTFIESDNIDLSADNAYLNFFAQWDIESGWDYVQVLASDNGGSSWTALQTENTVDGTGGVQPIGEPVFEGSNSWASQSADLSNYSSNNFKIRFELGSDMSVNGDGFYFDDLQIVSSVDDIAPVITGQNIVNIPLGNNYFIDFADLQVTDEDDVYPAGFCLTAMGGENYTIRNYNEIIPDDGYQGELIIPVKVCDGYKYSNEYNLIVNVTTTTTDDMMTTTVKVSPNPASDYIQIECQENIFKVNIYDTNGKIVIGEEVNSKKIIISNKNLIPGIYFAQILTNKSSTIQKIIIR